MNVPQRKTLLIALVAIFFTQTWFVYSDPIGAQTRLSDHATQGRGLWLKHNCQSCHQLFGFGGFLGPDLTNVAARYADSSGARFDARLAMILTVGTKVMPAFDLDQEQRGQLASYLREIDEAGVGQHRAGPSISPQERFTSVVQGVIPSAGWTEAEAYGWALIEMYSCISCHLPNESSSLQAPRLTTLMGVSGEDRVRKVLAEGSLEKGMPNFGLSEDKIESLVQMLTRLQNADEGIRKAYETAPDVAPRSLKDLPWFEYSR